MKILNRPLVLVLLALILVGCGMDATPIAPEPTVGPPLPAVSSAECLNASDGPITIWHLGADNTTDFTCAPKVIVNLTDEAIAYDGRIIYFDDLFTLVDGLGQVYTKEEILNGDWPDTIWDVGEETEDTSMMEWRGEGFVGWRR